MSLEQEYQFKPHEMPMVPGGAASPVHSRSRNIQYMLIGILLSITAGLQNGVLMASLPELRGALGLTMQEGAWVQVAYFMTYACVSPFYFKIRLHFGLNAFVKFVLWALLLSNILQLAMDSFAVEIIARGISGLASGGLFTTSLYYMMQALAGPKKLSGAAYSTGIMQSATTLAQIFLPFIFADGDMFSVFLIQFAFVLLSIAAVLWLPLPPSLHFSTLNKMDVVTFIPFAVGIACLMGFLVQGRVMWWTTDWLGYLLAAAIAFVGLAFWLESRRESTALDWQWVFSKPIVLFGLISVVLRILGVEQTVGAAGLLSAVGMGKNQLVEYYSWIFIASIAGIVVSMLTLNLQDIRRAVVVAYLGIFIASYWEIGAGVLTRPEQLYISQSIMAFACFYFAGPLMVEGLIRAFAKGPNYIMNFVAVFSFAQTIGVQIGTAILSAFVTIRTREHLRNIADSLTLTDPKVALQVQQSAHSLTVQIGDSQLAQTQAVGSLVNSANTQATVLAYNDLFTLICYAAGIAFVYSFAVWSYQRYKGINVIGKELNTMMARMKKQ